MGRAKRKCKAAAKQATRVVPPAQKPAKQCKKTHQSIAKVDVTRAVTITGRLQSRQLVTNTITTAHDNNMHVLTPRSTNNDKQRLHTTSAVVTSATRETWRKCLQDVQTINIPDAPMVRTTRTRNAFVTRVIVLLAYLIVHAEDGKPIPCLSGKFVINEETDNLDNMAQEIVRAGIDYVDKRLKWNSYGSPDVHIRATKSIGSWLGNQLLKVKHHGTWKIVARQVVGSPKGLYKLYKNLLETISINVDMP